MKERNKKIKGIFIRYLLLILIALPGFDLFYYIFSPITIYPLQFILSLFYNVLVQGNTIFANGYPIEIIGACVAGSAYYFLLILNLTTEGINAKKRVFMIGLSFAIFYVINLLRIVILSIMYVNGSSFFDFTHKIFWYAGSTIFVIAIWFLEVKIFKIKGIPIYDDLKFLYKKSSINKSRK
jgi:exosortase/archaeosortase family protein